MDRQWRGRGEETGGPTSASVQRAPGKSTLTEALQRQAAGGAAAIAPAPRAQLAGGGAAGTAVQHNKPPSTPPAPVGRAEKTDFGTYWVVPDGSPPQVGIVGEQISATDFAALEAAWTKIKDGTGQIKIKETGDDGTAYAGFKAKMITQFGKLLSKPVGRGVVTSLIGAGHTVTIVPSGPRTIGGARRGAGSVEKPDGSANTGGDSTILIEAGLKDTDIVCYDPAGKKLGAPIFLILGHELIHATHNDAGRNHSEKATAGGAAYPDLEEEETIATGAGATENKLRAEHGLGVRKGHRLTDTRRSR